MVVRSHAAVQAAQKQGLFSVDKTNNASAAIVQAIHHKVHFLINSSLQACQDSSKGPIQPTALLALCCSLQILEVCTTCLSTSHVLEHCSHILIWLPC